MYAIALTLLLPLDLIHIPQESKVSIEVQERAQETKKFYEQVRAQIEKVNEQYKSKANKNRLHLRFKLEDLI